MPLNATVGDISANSYVTIEEANAYFADRSNASSWSTSTQQEQLLITMSRLIDWQLKFKGVKTSELQAMQFPRTGIVLPDGYAVANNVIPVELKQAVFELALLSLDTDRTSDDPLAGLEEVKAGPLTIKTASRNDNPKNPIIPDFVRLMLSGYISTTGIGVYRLIRA